MALNRPAVGGCGGALGEDFVMQSEERVRELLAATEALIEACDRNQPRGYNREVLLEARMHLLWVLGEAPDPHLLAPGVIDFLTWDP